MSGRRVQVVVLCEGLKDQRFAYRCLVACGWRRDQIAYKISPPGKESAYTFVLNNYPAEVHANRNGKKKERALLTLIDADTAPEGQREKELDSRLRSANQKKRQPRERIAVWVPRRQLETWVYFLTQGRADEETDYKRQHLVDDRELRPAADKLALLLTARSALPRGAVPSLKKEVEEFGRVLSPRSVKAGRARRKP